MSQLYDMRDALKAAIIAANIGWVDETILIKRQGSLWNNVATAISNAKHGAILHIGVAAGESADDESLEMEITLPLTILCKPQVSKDATPEEDLWEALVTKVHDLRLNSGDAFIYRFRFQSFTDIDIAADGGTSYLGRQTIFKRRLSL